MESLINIFELHLILFFIIIFKMELNFQTWWLVLKLSICFLKIVLQKSLQTNFIMSKSSLKVGQSFVNLLFEKHMQNHAIVRFRWKLVYFPA